MCATPVACSSSSFFSSWLLIILFLILLCPTPIDYLRTEFSVLPIPLLSAYNYIYHGMHLGEHLGVNCPFISFLSHLLPLPLVHPDPFSPPSFPSHRYTVFDFCHHSHHTHTHTPTQNSGCTEYIAIPPHHITACQVLLLVV